MASTTDLARSPGPPPGSVLVRVRATDPTWPTLLPAVPSPHVVTVSVSRPGLRDTRPTILRRTGYRIVGIHTTHPATDGEGSVDLLVTSALIDAHPRWWQDLVTVADRAFDLRHGPVQRVLGPEIALHITG